MGQWTFEQVIRNTYLALHSLISDLVIQTSSLLPSTKHTRQGIVRQKTLDFDTINLTESRRMGVDLVGHGAILIARNIWTSESTL